MNARPAGEARLAPSTAAHDLSAEEAQAMAEQADICLCPLHKPRLPRRAIARARGPNSPGDTEPALER